MTNTWRWQGSPPAIGIGPTIDGRRGEAAESLRHHMMALARSRRIWTALPMTTPC